MYVIIPPLLHESNPRRIGITPPKTDIKHNTSLTSMRLGTVKYTPVGTSGVPGAPRLLSLGLASGSDRPGAIRLLS